ncbi:SCP2 sterol-binding domain-containing protein [Hugenholtzia roseola]|uniref:SCP2 sterol-binding domain-containing protein n=1 Tax=Hugenholtzia roseola TaxID=1002 RepID=UPI000401E20B|nr:SCP2 sterol-binding domain-containing protein [Hugenholtzia roseola]
MSLEAFENRVKKIVGTDSGLGKSVKFDLKGEGVVFVGADSVVSQNDADADCTVKISLADANKMIDGDLNLMAAYMTGKVKVNGDMETAMKVVQLIARRTKEEQI